MRWLAGLVALFVCCGLYASEWPRFRGPNGSGVSPDQRVPSELGKDRNVVWKTTTQKGHSSPVVANDRVFLTGWEGDERALLCYNAANGEPLWRKAVVKARTETVHPLNGPTTPTVATDGRSVFAFFPEFGMVAYSFDGKEQWRAPMGPFSAIQGIASSPVCAEGNVIVLIDTPDEAYLVAFDTKTGKQNWKIERPIGIFGSYATPALYQPTGSPPQLVVNGALELTGYQARTGERLWWAHGVTTAPAASPLIDSDFVYTVEQSGDEAAPPPFKDLAKDYDKNHDGKVELAEITGNTVNDQIMRRVYQTIDKNAGNKDGVVTEQEYNASFSPGKRKAGLVCTRLNGRGDVSETHVRWRHGKGLPYVTTMLLYQGVLYSIRNGGILSTFDPETGKLLREERLKDAIGDYYASPVAAGRKVYFISQSGKLTVVQAGADWKVISTADLEEDTLATPAIANDRLYVRTDQTLYCFGEKQ
jgi:outer membrane protein assembly factor BamB